ncbi:MAG: hypothetical protein KME67_03975 [Candidatus Thiodiazotropha sp. (ex Codakia orbicularis)]|nr:hypothetical protein [Candidatus Thiodiazotropha sp. (ex Codakia orbicularis)]
MGRPGMDRNAWKPDDDDDRPTVPVWYAVMLLIAFCSLPIACAVYG